MTEFLEPRPRLDGPVELVEPDPAWPQQYAGEERRIRAALGPGAVEVHHAGSTSVPGLAAKPILDVVLVVADPRDEDSYVPALVDAGYVLRLRQPEWHEHRLLRRDVPAVTVHVFGVDSPETERMLLFRDTLRTDPVERDLYLAAKRELAARTWAYVQDYADAKSAVVEGILARATAG